MTQSDALQILLLQTQALLIPKQYRAVEDIDGGDFVTLVFYSNTDFRIRRGLVSSVNIVNGFIKNPVLAGDYAWFYPLGGINDRLSGLALGQTYYMDPLLPGKVTLTSPVGTDVIQIVGKAINSTTLDTKINYVENGTGGSALPSGPAGGDLSGTYPNPTVAWANGYPTYDSRYLQLAGGTMIGNLILNTDPGTGLQAATKQYVDNLINGIDWKEAAHVGTVTVLPTYIVSGGGQVLTGAINGAIPSATTDGHTILINERLLVKDEVGGNLPNNGIYKLTQVGDAFTPYILTRTSDANTSTLLQEATISIIYGSTLSNSIWHLNPASVPIVIGTTNLTWVEVGGSGITTLNTLTAVTQTFATGTSGSDFNISSATSTHTFNLPTASATVRGAVSPTDWSNFNSKEPAITPGTVNDYWRGDKTWQPFPTLLAGNDGSNTRRWLYEGTGTNPSSTYFKADTSTVASITTIQINLTDAYSLSQSTWLAAAASAYSASNKVILQLIELGSSTVIGSWYVQGIGLAGSFYGIALTGGLIQGTGTLTVGTTYSLSWVVSGTQFTAVPTTRTISTTSPLAGGGDLSADRTFSIADAVADGTTKGAAAFNANDFNSSGGVISIDYTNGQAASSSTKGFLTSADWTTFNNKLSSAVYKSTTNGTASSGTTNTVSASQLITGGTFTVGEIIYVMVRAIKTGTVGSLTLRIYTNTTAVISGATLVATYLSSTASNVFLQIERNLLIKSATNTQVVSTTGNLLSDAAVTSAVSALNIDWSINQYIIFAVQNGNAGDSSVVSGYKIWEA